MLNAEARMMLRFYDRTDAGEKLATRLKAYANRADTIVLGLPRGGVPVAYEVAHALNLPLDICLVRKIGTPGDREYAVGAIAKNGVCILNHKIIDRLDIPHRALAQVIAEERQELQRRENVYRAGRSPLAIQGRIAILIDDGLATGATMMAALASVRSHSPKEIIVAVPVAPQSVFQMFKSAVYQVVCLAFPEPFHSIGLWYDNFSQTTDQQVCNLLSNSLVTLPKR